MIIVLEYYFPCNPIFYVFIRTLIYNRTSLRTGRIVTRQDHMDPVLDDNCLLEENDYSEILDARSLIPLWLKSTGCVWFFCLFVFSFLTSICSVSELHSKYYILILGLLYKTLPFRTNITWADQAIFCPVLHFSCSNHQSLMIQQEWCFYVINV